VDDDDAFRRLLAQCLDATSVFRCSWLFVRAEEALHRLNSTRAPDIILLDQNMPGITGIEAIPVIRKIAPRTKIILCTTFDDSELESLALREGADGFAAKHELAGTLPESISRILERRPARVEKIQTASCMDPHTTSGRALKSASFSAQFKRFKRRFSRRTTQSIQSPSSGVLEAPIC
jgi:DNA-binding NarL/FixJ family response regulator